MQNWTLHNCVLNFYNNRVIYACGIECYDCEFHNNPDDNSVYSFRFANGNVSNLTRGHFLFRGCTFEKLRGTGDGVDAYAFFSSEYPVIIEECNFKTSLELSFGTYAKNYEIRGSKIESLLIRRYGADGADVLPVTIDNCTVKSFGSRGAVGAKIEIVGSKIGIISDNNQYKLNGVSFNFCEVINNVTRSQYYQDTAVEGNHSTFDFVSSTPTGAFSLVRCYVKGLVTESSFTGTKQGCTFETPFATSGATADRPSASAVGAGFTYFDTDLGKMIVSNGTAWVNMDGTALS